MAQGAKQKALAEHRKKKPLISLRCKRLFVCIKTYSLFVHRRNAHVVKHEGVDVGVLFDDFGSGLSGSMTRFGFYADKRRVVAALFGLQLGNEFKRVCRYHAVVVVGSGYQRCRITCASFDIVQR